MDQPKHPQILLSKKSVEHDNVFEVIGKVRVLMESAGLDHYERTQYINEATSGDHDHFVATTKKWFTVS